MNKEVWQTAKPFIFKSFVWLVLLPLIGIIIGATLCLLVDDKTPLWKVGIGVATIGMIWGAIGLWQFLKILCAVLKLNKIQSTILKAVSIAIVVGIGFLMDYVIGGGK